MNLSLFLMDALPIKMEDKLRWEKELLGLYVSGHPLERVREKIEKSGVSIRGIRNDMRVGASVTLACIIEEIKVFITKKNDQMAFLKIADLGSSIEGVIFPKSYTEFQSILKVDATVAVMAKITERNGEKSLIVEKVKAI